MRGLMAAVAGMGVLIVAMTVVVAVTLVHRMSARGGLAPESVAASLVLDEPAGTRIVSISPAGDRLAVLLQGGGPDRVLLVDALHDRVVGRLSLGR
jgi:hypothetical protein